jgi:hypothetical protein
MLLAEHTGAHQPLDVDWSFAREATHATLLPANGDHRDRVEDPLPTPVGTAPQNLSPVEPAAPVLAVPPRRDSAQAGAAFANLWEFAVAVNRADPIALAAAREGPGDIPIEGADVRKLLGTMWFRSVVTHLSLAWLTRLFDALRTSAEISNHVVRLGRQHVRLSELGYAQLREILASPSLTDAVRQDVELLVTIGRVWGEDALRHFQFREMAAPRATSGFASLLQGLRPRLARRD